jgi:hypothetical protein
MWDETGVVQKFGISPTRSPDFRRGDHPAGPPETAQEVTRVSRQDACGFRSRHWPDMLCGLALPVQSFMRAPR